MKFKVCDRCKKEKPLDEFGKKAAKPDGLQPWCRDCKIEYNHRWYELNKERHRDYVNSHKPPRKHLCKNCGKGEPEVSFYIKRQGDRYYPRFLCYACDGLYKKKYPTKKEAEERQEKKRVVRRKISRKDEAMRCRYILSDSKRDDKKKGRQNDLDREFIRKLIDEGCAHCSDREARMTLDRIDNSIGHIKSNVVASCMRCNYFRRDMPYDAWLLVAPKIRQARLLGLLDGWNPGTIKSQRKVTQKEIDSIKEL